LKVDNPSLRPKSADDPPRVDEESAIIPETFDATDQEVTNEFSELELELVGDEYVAPDNADDNSEAVGHRVDTEAESPAAATAAAAERDPTPPASEPVEAQSPVFDCN
jgi:hypothetical protein